MLQAIKNSTGVPTTPQGEPQSYRRMSFSSNSNKLERNPQNDEFENKKMSKKKKITIGVVTALGISAIVIALTHKTEGFKKFIEKLTGKKKSGGPSGGTRPAEPRPGATSGAGATPGSGKPGGNVKPGGNIKPVKPNEPVTIKEGSFKMDGNTFEYKNGKLVSYKNSEGVELIEKYNNPTTEGDKIYKTQIDAKLKELTEVKPEVKPVNPEVKPETKVESKVETVVEVKPEVKAETEVVLKDTTFKMDGNTFEYKNGKLVSYKNSEGVELIEKYNNPTSEGDKVYKAQIDAKLKELAEVKPEVKPVNPEVKPEVKPEVVDAKPEVKSEVKPETKVETKTDTTVEAKPEVKPATEVKPEVKLNEGKDFVFDMGGNHFEIKDGKLVSYKNSKGEELISKYNNPEAEGDKAYKVQIDAKIKELMGEKASTDKVVETSAKPKKSSKKIKK